MTEEVQLQVFGTRYQPIAKIARGGMADVYEARDLLLDRLVALKVLFAELSTNPTFVERFRREAQSAAALSHPNIVSVYDWGPANGTYFIAMELVSGQTLAQLIRTVGVVPPDQAASIGADVALALAFAHRHGVVHRDIKPSNVLITEDGIVKVADFGIARAVANDEDLTQTGSVLGTATYISPEQARGEDLDGRSDIYSLGIVLYEMLTGTPPFLGETPIAVAYKHVTEAPTPLRNVNPRVSAELETVVMRCLAKQRDQRYPDATALRVDLQRVLEHRPLRTTTTQTALGERTMAIGAVEGVGDRTQLLSRVEDTASIPAVTPPVETARRRRRWPWILLVIVVLLALAGGLLYAKLAGSNHHVAAPLPRVAVPNVVGSQEQGAAQVLSNLGLQSALSFRAASASSGTVIAESPRAGTKVQKGSTVDLVVSSGPAAVTVPKVVGETASTAEAKLLALGFNVSTNYQAASAPQGTVVAESPTGGTSAPHGSTVVLTVSNGPSSIAVPNVVGLSLASASNKLGADQLAVGTVTYQASSSVPNGDVISTSPAPGTKVAPGSSVALVVSQGNEATVPNVVGDPVATAEQDLTNAGFTYTLSQPNPPAAAVVESTSPAAGTQAPVGSSVTITWTTTASGGPASGGPTPSAG
ncbi:serine/threonine protein kinase with PASTA sensor(s) [Acidimicrobium ferrooxidans DSM 10331]|uniref:non-specific serine/threonine protein kinase n=1 Tax=Acidimicrobium ferrooxidans (strain DSM 10331 / JCM 15462 / NBRC 103882 / ICP) TaxID=525909 RepID=C7M1K9_ACIFD|nr:Stk1 family PASTA domain-containing Ser/Thr kinase [Acidimicrobium ferrooxidans]ACU53058.1 serine/threonine protein kinase with PASTA sensor(s) [Acidimicrobium ferrooxidans DSM 10331]